MSHFISNNTNISKLADIEDSVRGSKLIVKDGCHIDSFVKIKFAGGSGDISIGEKCYINSGTVLYSGNGIQIGNKVLIAANCTIAPVNHGINRNNTILEQPFMKSKGGIIIEDDVWIGANSVILDGVFIAKGCVIAAGSVATGKLEEPYGIYAGIPAKLIGHRD